MTFKEAYAKLKAIADGKYFVLYYTLGEHPDGEQKAECRLYLGPGITHDQQPTWEAAFKALDAELHPQTAPAPDLNEAPE